MKDISVSNMKGLNYRSMRGYLQLNHSLKRYGGAWFSTIFCASRMNEQQTGRVK